VQAIQEWMKWPAVLLLLVFAAPAGAGNLSFAAVDRQVRPDLLSKAVRALQAHPEARHDRIGVVDFSKPSTEPRFYLINLKDGKTEAFLTAHGMGSDPVQRGIPQKFSNIANTKASSLGAYLAANTYIGKHGLSLTLDGLDPTNSSARARDIVLHSAPYMTTNFISSHGRPGRSWGCFVVDPKVLPHVITWLQGGTLIYAGK